MTGVSVRTRPVSVRLPLATVDQLDAFCAASQRSRGQVIDDLIFSRTARIRAPLAAMAQLCAIRAAIVQGANVDSSVLSRVDELISQLAPRVLQLVDSEAPQE